MRNYAPLLLFFLLTVAGNHIMAQQKKSAPLAFHSINSIGLHEGEAGSALLLQTLNGVQYRSWFAGLGAGIDYYRFRGVPVFLDIRKYFGAASNHFFVYGDLGMHAHWLTDQQKKAGFTTEWNLKNGLYTDAGLGYSIKLGSRQALLLSAGYSRKTIRGTQTDYTPIAYDGPPAVTQLHFNMNRLAIKAGIQF
jgi:hypothetical protein